MFPVSVDPPLVPGLLLLTLRSQRLLDANHSVLRTKYTDVSVELNGEKKCVAIEEKSQGTNSHRFLRLGFQGWVRAPLPMQDGATTIQHGNDNTVYVYAVKLRNSIYTMAPR
jgi:hypothetical protein